jgi:hypothetical protein
LLNLQSLFSLDGILSLLVIFSWFSYTTGYEL